MTEKKIIKSEKNRKCSFVGISFWTMLLLFVLMLGFSLLKWRWPSAIAGFLFLISVFVVFISSIKKIFPENSMAYVALGIAIIFILCFISMFVMYLLIAASMGLGSGAGI